MDGSGPVVGPQDDVVIPYIVPKGLAAAVLTFGIFFGVTSLGIVSLRLIIRLRSKTLGADDGLMLLGLVLYLADVGFASYATFEGLGTQDANLTKLMKQVGLKYVVIWQLFYITSLVCIKNSICLTLLRIAVEKVHRWALFITLFVSTAVFLVGFIGIISVCRPIEAQWVLIPGACADREITIIINYVISTGAIFTDWACAIIPAFILRKTQMRRMVKLSIGIVLGLGSLASLSTFVRLPYLKTYGIDTDFLYNVANIVLWSIFEGGLGLIAGSLPMLRQFFKRVLGTTVSGGSRSVGPSNAISAGLSNKKPSMLSASQRHRYSTHGSIPYGRRDWEQLDDINSDTLKLQGVREEVIENDFPLQEFDQSTGKSSTKW
ncbi:hypothetical protein BX600DRAFT_514342 [Xylariales sp. PMI_506]|nr:hypothetical protein BX600DRAFT_514342 [Xylariales sp. PMI_506]